jgi:hypothetical protein
VPAADAQLPLCGQHAGTRKAALAVLGAMLAAPDLARRRDGSPALTPEYCAAALGALASHELVQLLDWPATAAAAPQLPWCALALLGTLHLIPCQQMHVTGSKAC